MQANKTSGLLSLLAGGSCIITAWMAYILDDTLPKSIFTYTGHIVGTITFLTGTTLLWAGVQALRGGNAPTDLQDSH